MIPPFTNDGNLPPGIHSLDDWEEFARRFGTTPQRQALVHGLHAALQSLQRAGCEQAYVDGSFITQEDTPRDFDGCWDPRNVDPRKLDPVLTTFDRGRATQKAKYGGELFPATAAANRAGHTYLNFFQQDKTTGQPKGVVSINLRTIKL